jgi:hypothetical protein
MPPARREDADNAGLTLLRYGKAMNDTITAAPTPEYVEQILRDELAQGDSAIATAQPILRHLLANDGHALFSDEVIARVRGMMLDVARQLLEAQAEAAEAPDRGGFIAERQDELVLPLFDDAAFLSHAHALAVEAQLLDTLRLRSDLDPVLTPLVQETAADSHAAMAGLAMAVLAAQARFVQHQRRMELPLRDLPGELFHKALLTLRVHAGEQPSGVIAERRLRESFDEAAGRPGLLTRLVSGMECRAARALAIDHAGLSVFVTALAMATGQDRDLAVLSLTGRQFARLALSLRAAGLAPNAVEAQFVFLHPEVALPDGFELLGADSAGAMLTTSLPAVSL